MEAALKGVIQKRNSALVPPSSPPEAAISWLARGIARGEQGRELEAAADLQQAGRLYRQGGNDDLADQLDKAPSSCATTPKSPMAMAGAAPSWAVRQDCLSSWLLTP